MTDPDDLQSIASAAHHLGLRTHHLQDFLMTHPEAAREAGVMVFRRGKQMRSWVVSLAAVCRFVDLIAEPPEVAARKAREGDDGEGVNDGQGA